MSISPQARRPGRPLPIRPEPRFTQLAALCWRAGARGREVLLVTSSSGRWILPKGWPIDGQSRGQAAMTEAWEEGGVARGKVRRRAIGSYIAIKRTPQGDDVPCRHEVYAIEVSKSLDQFPEADRRDRLWCSPAEAALLVDEEGLRDILARF